MICFNGHDNIIDFQNGKRLRYKYSLTSDDDFVLFNLLNGRSNDSCSSLWSSRLSIQNSNISKDGFELFENILNIYGVDGVSFRNKNIDVYVNDNIIPREFYYNNFHFRIFNNNEFNSIILRLKEYYNLINNRIKIYIDFYNDFIRFYQFSKLLRNKYYLDIEISRMNMILQDFDQWYINNCLFRQNGHYNLTRYGRNKLKIIFNVMREQVINDKNFYPYILISPYSIRIEVNNDDNFGNVFNILNECLIDEDHILTF